MRAAVALYGAGGGFSLARSLSGPFGGRSSHVQVEVAAAAAQSLLLFKHKEVLLLFALPVAQP